MCVVRTHSLARTLGSLQRHSCTFQSSPSACLPPGHVQDLQRRPAYSSHGCWCFASAFSGLITMCSSTWLCLASCHAILGADTYPKGVVFRGGRACMGDRLQVQSRAGVLR